MFQHLDCHYEQTPRIGDSLSATRTTARKWDRAVAAGFHGSFTRGIGFGAVRSPMSLVETPPAQFLLPLRSDLVWNDICGAYTERYGAEFNPG
jgi:hypothetical protein